VVEAVRPRVAAGHGVRCNCYVRHATEPRADHRHSGAVQDSSLQVVEGVAMTVAVAVKVFDGLVLATDSATTFTLSGGGHRFTTTPTRSSVSKGPTASASIRVRRLASSR
jgi:hypothetical protein